MFFTTHIHPLAEYKSYLLICFLCGLISFRSLQAQEKSYDQIWADPEVEQKIEQGIRQHRMGEARLRFVDGQGKPLKSLSVELEQLSNQFLFGANLFMLHGFSTPEQNKKYEETFLHLFNHGTIPFYWAPLEPRPGQLRFTKNSVPIYRRPPPDAVLEFCKTHNIYPKGHTLVWDNPQWAVPQWLPQDETAIQPLIDQRIEQIAERYKGDIPMWDVVNEIKNRHMQVPMPRDFALKAFQKAQQVFPAQTALLINETTSLWYDRKREYSMYYLVIENLLLKGARIDGIGIQCHFFHGDQEFKDVLSGKQMRPEQIYETLDTYAHFGKPLHITEVTIPTIPNSVEGQQIQANVARNLYRIWFSHPAVASVVWWNMVDGSAAPGEDKWRGGFLNEDFSPKLSYQVLDQLINREWKTAVSGKTGSSGSFNFTGFYGRYKVKVKKGKQVTEKEINFLKGNENEFVISM
jgi:endo-1,4-beta-xylanase